MHRRLFSLNCTRDRLLRSSSYSQTTEMEKAYRDQAILLSRLEKVIHHSCSASHKSAVVPTMTMMTGRTSFHNRKFECNDYTRSELKSLRIVYLASLAQSNIMEGKLLTKRDVYYMKRGLFPNPQAVDRALTALSEIVQAPRNDLNIVAAPKGLVAGSIAFTDEDGHSVNVSLFGADGCLIPCRPERMQEVRSNAHAVVLLEKETAFHSLLHEPSAKQLLQTCIFATGKGYPDVATRMFLDAVSRAHRAKGVPLPIFVLTDADPHGIHIAYCYIRDLPDCHFRWIGVRPSDQGSLFQVHESALLPVTPAESVLLESLLQRLSRCAINETESLAPLIAELNVLKSTGKKFEIEAIACKDFGADMSGLLRYLLDRT